MATLVELKPVGEVEEPAFEAASQAVHVLDDTSEGVRIPLPHHLLLGSLADQRFRMLSPLTVHLANEEGHVVAEAIELDEFGYGLTSADAVRDLQRTIVELYVALDRDSARLGPDLQRVWAVLQEKLARRLS